MIEKKVFLYNLHNFLKMKGLISCINNSSGICYTTIVKFTIAYFTGVKYNNLNKKSVLPGMFDTLLF